MGPMQVLFLCPHSAGKSLLAASFFTDAIKAAGLQATADVAGTEPDEINIPSVEILLVDRGHTINWHPRRLASDDLERADIIVNMGCNREDIPTSKEVRDWEVPMLSEDFEGSVRAVEGRVALLVAELRAGSARSGGLEPPTS